MKWPMSWHISSACCGAWSSRSCGAARNIVDRSNGVAALEKCQQSLLFAAPPATQLRHRPRIGVEPPMPVSAPIDLLLLAASMPPPEARWLTCSAAPSSAAVCTTVYSLFSFRALAPPPQRSGRYQRTDARNRGAAASVAEAELS